ncbi:MAG: hypothetical protein C5S45_09890 [Candidatus Methanocomedens sp.]|nr:MAG: hypothetical protein C5S45_09890 [ANME-2 cluster archaeon]
MWGEIVTPFISEKLEYHSFFNMFIKSLTIVENTMLVSITSSIYTSFLYTLSHIPFLTFLPRAIASSYDNLLSDAKTSSNSSSDAVFLIASVTNDKTAATDLTISGNDVPTSTVENFKRGE